MSVNIQAKLKTDFFGPNLPKNGFWGPNFKKLSPDLDSAPPSSLACQFSVKIFLGKSSNNVEGVAESWVDAQMSWLEVEMSRVQCLVIPNFKNTFQMN